VQTGSRPRTSHGGRQAARPGGSRHRALFTRVRSGKQPAASAPQGLPLFEMSDGGRGVRMRQAVSRGSTSDASNSDTVEDLYGEDDDDNEQSDENAPASVRSVP
jgi:hypothetical protein